jgi:hypothetical protein
MTTLALVPSLPEKTAPSPCQIIAGLMLSSGITPDRLEGATAHLAAVVPSTAKFSRGIRAAYFDLNPRAS